MAQYFLIAGSAIFLLLGLIHALYTVLDLSRPRRFAPTDATLIDRMRESTVRLSQGGSTMWDKVPAFGIAVATVLFAGAWLLH